MDEQHGHLKPAPPDNRLTGLVLCVAKITDLRRPSLWFVAPDRVFSRLHSAAVSACGSVDAVHQKYVTQQVGGKHRIS